MLFRFFKYILLNSSLFQIYLKRSKKINFNGIENFNPIRINKKPLGKLMKKNRQQILKNKNLEHRNFFLI